MKNNNKNNQSTKQFLTKLLIINRKKRLMVAGHNPSIRRLQQEDLEFKGGLAYITNPLLSKC